MTPDDIKNEAPPARPAARVERELSLAGVTIVLLSCLTFGVTLSAGYSLILNMTSSGWHWKNADQTIDLTQQESDRADLFTFKKVDVKLLEDSLHMMAATEAMFKMDYGKSLSEINQISPERADDDPAVTTLKAECLLSLKQSDKVIELANRAIKEKPREYKGWLWRGQAYEQLKQYDKAISDYEKTLSVVANVRSELATKVPPSMVDSIEKSLRWMVYRRMGASYERSLDFKQAAQFYEKALVLQMPNLRSAIHPRVSREALAQAQSNVAELTRAIAARPDEKGLYLMRANAYKVLGKHELALLDYEKAKQTDSANFWYERAGAHYALGDYKKAASDLRKVHAEDPLYELPHMRQKKYSFAISPMASMKKSLVLRRFDKLIEDSPNQFENYLHRGVLEMAFREYDEAANDLSQYLKAKPEEKSTAAIRAQIYLALCRGLKKRRSEYQSLLESAQSRTDSKWWKSIISYLSDNGVTENMLLDSTKTDKARAVQAHYFIGQKLSMKGSSIQAAEHFKAGVALAAPVDEFYLCKLALLPDTNEDSRN